jgi:Fe-S-cluster containining protein
MANEKLVAAMKEKGVLEEDGRGGGSMKLGKRKCVFLGKDGCEIYDIRPVSCRNVVCFTESDSFRHSKGPLKRFWSEWYTHLKKHDLHPDRETGQLHPRALDEDQKAIDDFYTLRVTRQEREGDTPLCRVAYRLGGEDFEHLFDPDIEAIKEGMPRELKIVIPHRVRAVFNESELQGLPANAAVIGDVEAVEVAEEEVTAAEKILEEATKVLEEGDTEKAEEMLEEAKKLIE